jgi:glucose-1-phosphate cytidylyltransferase
MKAVILAGGLGSRLSEETDKMPKPLVPLGPMPIIWHIMKIYSHHGIKEFVLCLGYKGHMIKEFFLGLRNYSNDFTLDMADGSIEFHAKSREDWKISLIDTGDVTMTGGRLRRVRQYLGNETFCLTYGDGVSDIDVTKLIAFHRGHGRKATVTAVVPPGRFGALHVDGDKVGRFSEKIDNLGAYVNGGFFVLEPDCIDYVDGDATIWEQEPLHRLTDKGELMAYRHAGFWKPMDTLKDKRELDDMWNSGKAPWKIWD